MTEKTIKYLGYSNSWGMSLPEPDEYKRHYELTRDGERHHIEVQQICHCVSRLTCHTCWFSYDTYSSD